MIKKLLKPTNQYWLLALPLLFIVIFFIFMYKAAQANLVRRIYKFMLLYTTIASVAAAAKIILINKIIGVGSAVDGAINLHGGILLLIASGVYLIKEQEKMEQGRE